MGKGQEIEQIELDLLVEAVHRRWGVDFRNYARTSFRRRVRNLLRDARISSVSELQGRVLHDPAAMQSLLDHVSVNVTTMFRDSAFFRTFREQVVPHLRAVPFIRVWSAGCATGEEPYSLAILLEEEGLYDRARIYATDMNSRAVDRARAGIFPIRQIPEFTANYLAAGGHRAFSEYYSASHEQAILRHSLRRNVVFAQHDLAVDGSFNEFNVVLCRNVLIYFDEVLQRRVHELFAQSLRRGGFLCLGRRESLRGCPVPDTYEPVEERERIFRRLAGPNPSA